MLPNLEMKMDRWVGLNTGYHVIQTGQGLLSIMREKSEMSGESQGGKNEGCGQLH